ncbi:MAG: thiamine pyrophosphate-requiring protein [Anaerolineaceae bacterium]|nr:thiamine pyrophosphate-requiring protein [Anaerolineaceae bacterium]
MRVIDAIAQIMKQEGVTFLATFPTTPVIESAAGVGIRPVVCRQERVGVGMADGYARMTNGNPVGAFAMQFGPGAENAFAGVATAFSDSVPLLVLPLGHRRDRAQVYPHFSSARAFESVLKSVETINVAHDVGPVMRRAFNAMKQGRAGPAMVEIPEDVALEEVDEAALDYRPVKATRTAGDPQDIEKATRALVEARCPVILAGQGVLYAEASDDLVELAESLQLPVMTTMEGKSGFPEDHPLSLGAAGGGVMTGPAHHFLHEADVILAIGCSLTAHFMHVTLPPGKTIIHATNDERDLNKHHPTDHPILGDAKLVLRQFIEAVQDLGAKSTDDGATAALIERKREDWLREWMPKLSSSEKPITPYRAIWEMIKLVDPAETIVTHDSGSPRNQMLPFYRATTPRGYMGWGKSHALGTGLGLIMGAKLAQPDKFCVNFMGDAAFGMTGLDFETAVRCDIPILTVVFNNSTMAIETPARVLSHRLYRTRDLGGDYADMARAMGGYAERVEEPEEVGAALRRAKGATEAGQAALLEIITSEEITFSNFRNVSSH